MQPLLDVRYLREVALNYGDTKRRKIMGLIKAGARTLGGALADQWKDFFYCDSMKKM